MYLCLFNSSKYNYYYYVEIRFVIIKKENEEVKEN